MKQIDLSGRLLSVTNYKNSRETRKAASNWLRKKVFERDNYRCRMCLSNKDIEIHELTPQQLGGELSFDNCFTLCYRCHLHMHRSPYYKLLGKRSTKEGLRNALRKGKKLGRPKGSKDKKPRRKGGYYARYAKNR